MSDMTYRQLGRSGLTVSTVGLGCNAFGSRIDADRTCAVVRAALDAAITFFDTADIYGSTAGESETLLGRALGSDRADVIVATKFGSDTRGANGPDWGVRGSRRYVRTAVEASLRRLGTDWIDLYQLHEPDPHTPIAETLHALDELVAEGKIRYAGSSNFAAWQVTDADWTARVTGTQRFISAQNKYSLYDRSVEDELAPACVQLGIGILPYFPLEYGLLTGKYRRGQEAPAGTRLALQTSRLQEADFDRIEALERFGADRGLTPLQVAIGGLAAQPAVGSVIAGATRPEQVTQNAAAVTWQPTVEDLVALDAATGR
jgi:aryl-alcohol dehydrogenase-like predicted oxidoreductase